MEGVTLNKAAEALFSGTALNAEVTEAFLAEVLDETLGGAGIAHAHFEAGQSKWPKLADSTQDDKRKKGRIFEQTGRTVNAISRRMDGGQLHRFGSSADIYATSTTRKFRYSQAGIYAQIMVGQNKASITIGFNGEFRHSAGFNKARKQAAEANGADVKGLRGKAKAYAIRKAATIAEAEARLKGRKFAAKGSKGFGKLARGSENMAHANIVQRGKFTGISKDGKPEHEKPRPLMPFVSGDEPRIQRALDRAMTKFAEQVNHA